MLYFNKKAIALPNLLTYNDQDKSDYYKISKGYKRVLERKVSTQHSAFTHTNRGSPQRTTRRVSCFLRQQYNASCTRPRLAG